MPDGVPQRFLKAMKTIINDQPYWNRTQVRVFRTLCLHHQSSRGRRLLTSCSLQGRDHVFVFAGARGPHIFKDWKRVIKKSIFMTPEGDRSLGEQFNTWKDIVIPGRTWRP